MLGVVLVLGYFFDKFIFFWVKLIMLIFLVIIKGFKVLRFYGNRIGKCGVGILLSMSLLVFGDEKVGGILISRYMYLLLMLLRCG